MKASIAAAVLVAFASASAVPQKGGYHAKPLPQKPLVNSKQLQDAITIKSLIAGAQKLQDIAFATPGKNRQMGSLGHNNTVKYLVKELNALGGYYNVSTQEFASLIQVSGTFNLTINAVVEPSGAMEYSPSGVVSQSIVVVNNLGCTAADYPATVKGKIALISRGTCQFGLKSVLAGNAGALGAIIYNNIPGIINGTLGVPPRPEGNYIPTLGISQEKGTALVASINGGATVNAALNIKTDIQTYTTNNVIATTKGGNHATTLVVGAHTDSVAAGPGINDDGSGTIGILEVAKKLSKYKVNNAVTFGFWSGEEEGLLGSTYWVEHLAAADLAKVRAYLNFDMIASPNYINAIYDGDGSAFNLTGPAGSSEIEHFFEKFFKTNKQNSTATAFNGRSDYAAFIDNGIPAGGTFTGAEEIKTAEQAASFGGQAGVALDINYHGAGDTVANLNRKAFLLHSKSIAASVATYATSFSSLPPKAVTKRAVAATAAKHSWAWKGGKAVLASI